MATQSLNNPYTMATQWLHNGYMPSGYEWPTDQVAKPYNEALWSSVQDLASKGVDIEKIDLSYLFKKGLPIVRICQRYYNEIPAWVGLLSMNRHGLLLLVRSPSELRALCEILCEYSAKYPCGPWMAIYDAKFCNGIGIPAGDVIALRQILDCIPGIGYAHPPLLFFAEKDKKQVWNYYQVRLRTFQAACALYLYHPNFDIQRLPTTDTQSTEELNLDNPPNNHSESVSRNTILYIGRSDPDSGFTCVSEDQLGSEKPTIVQGLLKLFTARQEN
jgi:hypothetical protein